MRRVVPVVRALADDGLPVSVDTRRAAVMDAALEAGARIVNDMSALSHDPEARTVVARRGAWGRARPHAGHARDDAAGKPRYVEREPRRVRRAGRPRGRGGSLRQFPRSQHRRRPPASASARPPATTWKSCATLRCSTGSAARCSSALRARASSAGSARAKRPRRDCRAPSRQGCTRSARAPTSCGCTTSPRPARRSRSGSGIRDPEASTSEVTR